MEYNCVYKIMVLVIIGSSVDILASNQKSAYKPCINKFKRIIRVNEKKKFLQQFKNENNINRKYSLTQDPNFKKLSKNDHNFYALVKQYMQDADKKYNNCFFKKLHGQK